MAFIFHITRREAWQQAKTAGTYRADSLESQGFIHCSTSEQIMSVANAFYKGQRGLLLLCIDEGRLRSEVRYEPPDGPPVGDSLFPHIYGPLNPDAVVKVVTFEPGPDGRFLAPGQTARFGSEP
jgi:uncharacterized protein (DUF952 family)